MTHFSPFKDPAIQSVFALYPASLRVKLMQLRQLIIDTAAKTDGVGAITETLKWREPAYRPKKAGVGTTIRINAIRGSETRFAMFVPCQTTLIDMFRQHYSDLLELEGKRAILFDAARDLPRDEIAHCVALALTYHTRNSGKST